MRALPRRRGVRCPDDADDSSVVVAVNGVLISPSDSEEGYCCDNARASAAAAAFRADAKDEEEGVPFRAPLLFPPPLDEEELRTRLEREDEELFFRLRLDLLPLFDPLAAFRRALAALRLSAAASFAAARRTLALRLTAALPLRGEGDDIIGIGVDTARCFDREDCALEDGVLRGVEVVVVGELSPPSAAAAARAAARAAVRFARIFSFFALAASRFARASSRARFDASTLAACRRWADSVRWCAVLRCDFFFDSRAAAIRTVTVDAIVVVVVGVTGASGLAAAAPAGAAEGGGAEYAAEGATAGTAAEAATEGATAAEEATFLFSFRTTADGITIAARDAAARCSAALAIATRSADVTAFAIVVLAGSGVLGGVWASFRVVAVDFFFDTTTAFFFFFPALVLTFFELDDFVRFTRTFDDVVRVVVVGVAAASAAAAAAAVAAAAAGTGGVMGVLTTDAGGVGGRGVGAAAAGDTVAVAAIAGGTVAVTAASVSAAMECALRVRCGREKGPIGDPGNAWVRVTRG